MQLLAGLMFALTFRISVGEVKVQSKTEGEKVSMDCTFTMGSSANYYYFLWYRQHPGSGLQYILVRGGSTSTSDFAKERFDATADTSNGKTVLTISNLIPEDTAVYYCALWRSTVMY
ncbi:hypothetical protein GJAV_G00112130 [Gymnothorax javanicus]|nr:hypothetical protein GJAV_G00112130 [Gymnothorax javanicus]